jgi:hypothetical protein
MVKTNSPDHDETDEEKDPDEGKHESSEQISHNPDKEQEGSYGESSQKNNEPELH